MTGSATLTSVYLSDKGRTMKKTRLEALNMMRKSLEGLLALKDSGGSIMTAQEAANATTALLALPDEAQERLIEFFRTPGEHPDSEYHALADELGIEADQAETFAYGLLSSILGGGKSAGKTIDIPPDVLEQGMKVEAEHSDNPIIQRKIVADHFSEDPEYYTKLSDAKL